MRFAVLLAPVGLLSQTVLADGAAIVSVLSTIATDTLGLNTTVSGWDGGLLGSLPIVIQSTTLLNDINNGTKVATASGNLTLGEAVKVASATLALANTVNSTLTTIINSKKMFDRLLLSPVILLNLELEKSATDKLSAALIKTAQVLIQRVDDSLDLAIKAYNPFAWLTGRDESTA